QAWQDGARPDFEVVITPGSDEPGKLPVRHGVAVEVEGGDLDDRLGAVAPDDRNVPGRDRRHLAVNRRAGHRCLLRRDLIRGSPPQGEGVALLGKQIGQERANGWAVVGWGIATTSTARPGGWGRHLGAGHGAAEPTGNPAAAACDGRLSGFDGHEGYLERAASRALGESAGIIARSRLGGLRPGVEHRAAGPRTGAGSFVRSGRPPRPETALPGGRLESRRDSEPGTLDRHASLATG